MVHVPDAVEFDVPPGTDPAAIVDALRMAMDPIVRRPATLDRTLLDTFDGRLHAKGLVLVHEELRFALREGARERAGLAHPEKAPERLAVDDLPEGPLRAALAPLCGVRALQATASVRGRRRLLRVLDGERKTVVRLVAEEATLSHNGSGPGVTLRPRLHVEPVRGYAKDLKRVVDHCAVAQWIGTLTSRQASNT